MPKKDLPKLSIVTPSYNLGGYIERTIKSVLEQDYDNFEYMVIDGGSTDDTVDILIKYKKKYPDTFNWISEPDNGQTDAINKGLARSDGDWFAWINADDYYEPGAFVKVAKVMGENSGAGVIYGKNMTHKGKVEVVDTPPKEISFESFWRGNVIFGPAAFFNLKAVKDVGGFDVRANYWMDYDMFMRLIKNYQFMYVDELISHFSFREGQKSTDQNQQQAMEREAYKICVKNGGTRLSPLLLPLLPKPVAAVLQKTGVIR